MNIHRVRPASAGGGDFRVLFIYPNLMMSALVLPAGVSTLSACLKARGFQTRLFDTTFYRTADKGVDEIRMELMQLRRFNLADAGIRLKDTGVVEDLKKVVEEFRPGLVALTATEDVFLQGMMLLNSIREYRIPAAVGGVFAFFSPAEILQNDAVRYVCVGEGEDALVELCEALRAGRDPSGIRNLWVRQPDGRIVQNPMRPPKDINALPPPDYSIFEPERMIRPMQGRLYRMIPVEVQRGCPFTCTFCEAPSIADKYRRETGARYYRTKGMDRLMGEIRFLVNRYEGEYLYLNAETFLAMPDPVFDEFVRGYERIGLPFWMETRPETVIESKLRRLKDVGLHHMNVGIEHGNEDFRRDMLRRSVSNAQILAGLEVLDRLGISVTVNNIIGFPDETRDLVFDTIRLNRRIKSATVNAYIFQPYKGSRLYDVCKSKGYLPEDSRTKAFFGPVLKMPQLPPEELVGLQRTFCMYTELPERFASMIRIAEKLDGEGNRMFEDLKSVCRQMQSARSAGAAAQAPAGS